MLACKHGHDEIVKKLLDIPSLIINAQDSQRWTALMYAIDSDHGHIARRLLEAGARPDLAGKDREALRTLVESLVQMTTFISRIFLKLVELQFKVPIALI